MRAGRLFAAGSLLSFRRLLSKSSSFACVSVILLFCSHRIPSQILSLRNTHFFCLTYWKIIKNFIYEKEEGYLLVYLICSTQFITHSINIIDRHQKKTIIRRGSLSLYFEYYHLYSCVADSSLTSSSSTATTASRTHLSVQMWWSACFNSNIAYRRRSQQSKIFTNLIVEKEKKKLCTCVSGACDFEHFNINIQIYNRISINISDKCSGQWKGDEEYRNILRWYEISKRMNMLKRKKKNLGGLPKWAVKIIFTFIIWKKV